MWYWTQRHYCSNIGSRYDQVSLVSNVQSQQELLVRTMNKASACFYWPCVQFTLVHNFVLTARTDKDNCYLHEHRCFERPQTAPTLRLPSTGSGVNRMCQEPVNDMLMTDLCNEVCQLEVKMNLI